MNEPVPNPAAEPEFQEKIKGYWALIVTQFQGRLAIMP